MVETLLALADRGVCRDVRTLHSYVINLACLADILIQDNSRNGKRMDMKFYPTISGSSHLSEGVLLGYPHLREARNPLKTAGLF
jgi:hypothetical protein